MVIEKREQVFISSTFQDLIEERRAVMQTLLMADCLPSGMELFPASDKDKFDLIQGVIDLSDYYIVIVGGRYGSVDEVEQLSYTEMEFDYAIKQKKPVMGFLHGKPGQIIADKTELDPKMRKKLQAFRERVEERMVQYWNEPSDLPGLVALSLMQLRKTHPAEGWVRGNDAMTPEVVLEIAELKAKVAELTAELSTEKTAHSGVPLEDLAGGDELFKLPITFKYRPTGQESTWGSEQSATGRFRVTWDRIFAYLAPSMMNEASETQLRARLAALGKQVVREWYKKQKKGHKWGALQEAAVALDDFQGVLVQLSALGLIEVDGRKRGVNNKSTYWHLTPKGTTHMLRLRTVAKTGLEDKDEPEGDE